MVFSTIIFLFRFLPITLALYYLAPAKLKNTVLFLCSLVFYCWGEVRFFPVMVALILINYISGLAIEHFDQRPALRRAFLLAALIGSLGMLFYFKYANFVLRSANALLGNPLPDGGQWDMAISLIKKYGVVPSWVMPETVHSTGTAKYLPILNRKLREDALELRAMAKEGKDTAARREEMLAEIYNALCILYGQPPRSFDFEYTDKDEHYHCDRNLTPHTFLEKYVGNDLDDYVVIISSPIHALNRTYCQPFMGDVVEENMFWLNLSQEELEDLTIRQLQAGEGVMFSCDCHPDGDRANGYWDPDCFQYGEVLGGLTFGMTKAERLLTRESTMNHCMMFCGVNLDENGKADRWKIENSWGDASGQKGYYIGSEKWFKANVYQITVRKSLLSDAQRALLDQEPLPMKLWDPLA